MHTQAQRPYHLSCSPADAGTTLSWSVTGGVGWDGNNVHVPAHTQAQQILSSFLLSSSHTSTFLGMGWGGVITFMFLCTHRHSNLIIFLALQQTQALLFHVHLPVGWGGVIPFMFLCTHRHSNLLIFLALQQTQALLFHDHLLVGWGGVMTFIFLRTHMRSNLIIFLAFQQSHLHLSAGGVGWGNNVHVPVHTQAQQPYHLSCSPADTGTTLS